MNIEKMSKLIMMYPEFLDSCYGRMRTSIQNKLLHSAMITAIEVQDRQHVEEVLMNCQYYVPLEGVIYCMDVEFEIMTDFIEAYEED